MVANKRWRIERTYKTLVVCFFFSLGPHVCVCVLCYFTIFWRRQPSSMWIFGSTTCKCDKKFVCLQNENPTADTILAENSKSLNLFPAIFSIELSVDSHFVQLIWFYWTKIRSHAISRLADGSANFQHISSKWMWIFFSSQLFIFMGDFSSGLENNLFPMVFFRQQTSEQF